MTILKKSERLEFPRMTVSANHAGVRSQIAEFVIPREFVYEIVGTKPAEFRLATMETFSFTTAAGVTTHTVTLAGDVIRALDLPILGGNVIIRRRVPTPVAEIVTGSVDFVANTVTMTGLAAGTAHTVDIFYTFSEGIFEVVLWDDHDRAFLPIVNELVRALSDRRQYNINSAFFLQNQLMPEEFILRVFLTSPRVVSFDAFARNTFISIYTNVYKMRDFFDVGRDVRAEVKDEMRT